MTTAELSTFIKDQALKLGFDACGIAKAAPIPESEKAHFRSWIEGKGHAEMQYMEQHSEKRFDPRLLVEGCRSVIVVALNYEPAIKQDPEAPAIAGFAYGKDYHGLIRAKLKSLLQTINNTGQTVHGRAFADSAPIAERFWAGQAGLGWIGKNRHLILPGKGSCFLLGELLVDIDLDGDTPASNRCGQCRRCLEACPSNALNETSGLDANRCLSYLTIEKRGPFNAMEASSVGENNCLFGCDRCQEVCPWNRFSKGNTCPELQPKEGFLSMKRGDFEDLTEDDFNALFAESCLKRTGYDGFLRNMDAIKKSGSLYR
ncbi:MAG: tRNA epoxyqueuosine(34) reductase QueG [Bacteroidales bacterium]|nr:tRNA epoxyqueuosine(34) reductase QueG [Bacteroidales bacterium]